MAEDSKNPKEERVALDARTLTSLDPETLARLRSEFGVSVELKSTKPGLAALLDNLTKGGVAGSALLPAAEYDRGFDRTSPGYDKYYDRDRSMVNPSEAVSNPSFDASILNKLIRR